MDGLAWSLHANVAQVVCTNRRPAQELDTYHPMWKNLLMKHPPLWRALARKTKKWTVSQARLWIARIGVYTQPSFFIIGAQKCGTTVLFNYLCEHPDVVPGRRKEIHFFNRDDRYYGRGTNYYHSLFPLPFQLGKYGVTFDATPKYIYCRECPQRIHEYYPHAKMILLLRDPVERAYSAWNLFSRIYNEPQRRLRIISKGTEGIRLLLQRKEYPSFEEAVREEIDNSLSEEAFPEPSFVRRGLYAKQIERYFKYFHREQIKIIDSRRLRNETNRTLEDIAAFVGLRPHDWSRNETKRLRVAGVYKAPISQKMQVYLAKFYRPHNERLYELLSHDFGW